jgi:hypothetical protein
MAKKRTLATQDEQRPRDPNEAVRVSIALESILSGHTYEEARVAAGYAQRGQCWRAVQRELDRLVVPSAERMRKLHHLRLNKLRTVYMRRAMDGVGWDADRMLHFDEREAKLFGLDKQPDDLASAAHFVKRIILEEETRPNLPPVLELEAPE